MVVQVEQNEDQIYIYKDSVLEDHFYSVEKFIYWLFRHRCIGLDNPCHKFASEINEIIPRSSGKDSMKWKNRVPMCHEHHLEYHRLGTSDKAIEKLQERRAEYLETIGRWEYI